MPHSKRSTRIVPSFDIPEPVKSSPRPGWVYRSDGPERMPLASPKPLPKSTAQVAVFAADPFRSTVPLHDRSLDEAAVVDFLHFPCLALGFRMTTALLMIPYAVSARYIANLSRR